MRIRKNAKISPLVTSNSSENTHLICQLNQSPWDVPILDSLTPSPYPQVHGGNMFNGNGSLGDSTGPLGRVASLKISIVDNENYDNIYGEEEGEEEENETVYCCKTDVEGNLVCGREAKDGNSLCDFHLAHFRSSSNSAVHPVSKKCAKNRASYRAKKSKSESNPYEIYYYSGFGPRWGKKRGADKLAEPAKVVAKPDETEAAATTLPSSSNSPRNENFKYFEDAYEDDDDDDDEEESFNDGNGKKRGRKPIKARSLKSLM